MSIDSDMTEEIEDALEDYVEPEAIKEEKTIKKEKKKRNKKKKKISEGGPSDGAHSNSSEYVPR